MRDIIVAGCSFTNFRDLQKERVLDGHTPTADEQFRNGSYPEAIHRNYGNKVYNSGLMGNSVSTSVLSILSIANRLMKSGNNNFSVILQSTDFERRGIYVPDYYRKIKNIKNNAVWPKNNNYLFSDDNSGFIQFGGLSTVTENNYTDCESVLKIAKSFSENIYTPEYCNIDALTHILLLQNFCKANNIPYKIFFSSNLFCEKVFPFFDLDKKNVETYFKTFFIDKKLPKKDELGNIKSDPYVYDLFNMLDMDGIWFYETEETKYGGMYEWFFKNNEYKEGDLEYKPLYIEDTSKDNLYGTPFGTMPLVPDDSKHMLPITKAKTDMREDKWWDMGHPTYYYWERFVKEVMVDWNLF
jgi:hypothetical protein